MQYPTEIIESFKERFPELSLEINKVETPQELMKVVKRIRKQFYNDVLPYEACDGAIDAFQQEKKAQFDAQAPSRSHQEVREDWILHTQNEMGHKVARRWN